MVPSLDLQSNYIEPDAARRLVECFLDDFPLSKVAHFGPNLASILIANRTILHGIQRRVTRIYLSYEIDEKNAAAVRFISFGFDLKLFALEKKSFSR